MEETTYLVHHGIKGQRWGIRRFRNEDGSLTPAGKKRYGGSDKPEYTDHSVDPKYIKEHANEMSDAELNAALNRLNLQTRVSEIDKKTGFGEEYSKQFKQKIVGAAVIATLLAGVGLLAWGSNAGGNAIGKKIEGLDPTENADKIKKLENAKKIVEALGKGIKDVGKAVGAGGSKK